MADPLFGKGEVKDLLNWFEDFGIDYPWGDNPTPYRVWISEIMLQQTVVTAAIGHFRRWMELFPGVPELAAATEQQVLKAWEGLGYYSRARNILKGARYLMDTGEGRLPESYEELLKVPGIGDYTARAILSLAYGKPFPVLDANVRRIAQRLRARADWDTAEDRTLMEDLDALIPASAPGLFNCALMQLGQQVCRVKSPDCSACPLAPSCGALKQGLQSEIPAPKKRALKRKRSVLILLKEGKRYLLQQRSRGIGKDLWFIPACPPEKEEEIRNRLSPALVMPLKERVHLYTTWREALEPRLYVLDSAPADEVYGFFGDDPLCWVGEEELVDYPSPSVYRKILTEIPPLLAASRGLSEEK